MNSPVEGNGEWNLLEKILPKVPRETCEQVMRYVDLIYTWNEKTNLTGAKSRQEFIVDHIADCVGAWNSLSKEATWLDVGSGAGLPGLVWGILEPKVELILLDSSLKRTAFLQRVRAELHLHNVMVLPERFERLTEARLPHATLPRDLVSRGTAAPTELLKLATAQALTWRYWYIFSNEKIHHEYLTAAPRMGVEVEKIGYTKFSSGHELGRPGILTRLQKMKN